MTPARRRTNQPSEPERPPQLMVPAEQLHAEINDRLTKGQALLSQPVDDIASLEQRQADYYSWSEYNETLLKRSFDSPKPAKDYESHFGMGWPTDAPLPKRWEWLSGDISSKMRSLRSLQEQLGLFSLHPDVQTPAPPPPDPSVIGEDIFIVHGHNNEAKVSVARFLEKLLEREPIILHEQADCGRTIIEKFEEHATRAACAIVLLTADDTGGPKDGETRLRARQNVVLELGFFLGKLGRSRVIILYEPGVERPSDIQGMLYTELDNAGIWRNAVARELKAVGLEINLEALLKQ